MAREFARVKLSIWEDDDYRDLSVEAQHLYQVLMIHPQLNYAGVTDWRPAKLAGFARGWTIEDVELAAKELSERRYIVIDERTEEVLIRSFIRSDELLDSPNMAVAVRKAHMGIASATLRAVIVFELVRLRCDRPDLKGWKNVDELLSKASVNPSEIPSFNPSGKASLNPSGSPSETPSASPDPTPSANPSGKASPTTAPLTAPATATPSGGQPKRRTRLPDGWKPTEADIAWQRDKGISDATARHEFEIFRDHWKGNGETKADWSATWRNWLRRAPEFARNGHASEPARKPFDEFA